METDKEYNELLQSAKDLKVLINDLPNCSIETIADAIELVSEYMGNLYIRDEITSYINTLLELIRYLPEEQARKLLTSKIVMHWIDQIAEYGH